MTFPRYPGDLAGITSTLNNYKQKLCGHRSPLISIVSASLSIVDTTAIIGSASQCHADRLPVSRLRKHRQLQFAKLLKRKSTQPQRNTRPAIETVATPPPSRPALSRPLASHSFPMSFGPIRLPSIRLETLKGETRALYRRHPGHPTARVASSPAPF